VNSRVLFESFLPLEMLCRLHGGHGERPGSVELSAAVIFVDVSRYTNLVEQLAHRGQEGLHQIPNLLNRSYSRCVDEVCDRGGEIVYLVGDAMLAYWPAENDNLAAAVSAAVTCADAICNDRRVLPDSVTEDVGPALHIGVGAGAIWAGAIGGPSVWNLIVGGEAILQATACQALARRWQYAISEQAQAALNEIGWLRKLTEGGRVETVVNRPGVDWLSGFLAPQLREAVVDWEGVPTSDDLWARTATDLTFARRLDDLTEIRPVTALLARIVGLDHRSAQALAQYHTLCEALQTELNAREGPPGALHIDDKGLVYTAIFGSRGSFHRDDPYRAVATACAVTRATDDLGLTASIGVSTGEALFRVVGTTRRRQLLVLGAPLNRAARLMTSASGGVLCDSPTERASRSRFSFEQEGTLQLDGLEDVAAVFRPLEPRAAKSAKGKLIGRRAELDFLRQAYDVARAGGKQMVVISGEPGIGKTSLVNAFVDELQETAPVWVVQAERDDRRRSFLPWRRLLAVLVDLPTYSDGATLLAAISESFQHREDVIKRLPLLGSVLSVEIAQDQVTQHLDGAHRADATMRLLRDVFLALVPQPCILVFEDSQWFDSASWRLAEWIFSAELSILAVFCVRAEEIPQELRKLQHRKKSVQTNLTTISPDDPARFCRFLDLDELSDPSIRELVARTLGDVRPEQALADRIVLLAGGNPLFAEEIALTLKANGLISVREGLWRSLRPLDSLRYFEAVERAVRERLDRLETASSDVLKAASVVGRAFTGTTLKSLLRESMNDNNVERVLEALVDARFIRPGTDPGSFEFRHEQIRDVVYNSLPSSARRRLHKSLADMIEMSHASGTVSDIAVLVQHFEAAGTRDKLVTYADLAASNALQTGAYREAVAFLEICLGQEPRQKPRYAIETLEAVRRRRQLAEAHYGCGDLRAQGDAVRDALSLGGYPVPASRRDAVFRLLKVGLRLAIQQMLSTPPRRMEREGRYAWNQEIARCLSLAAVVDYFELRFSSGFCNLAAAVTHAERTGSTIENAVASAQLACGLGILGRKRACAYFMVRAERTAKLIGDPAALAYICNLEALWRIGYCDWEAVGRRLDQCQQLCLVAGDQLRWCNAQAVRFWSLYYRGERGSVLEQTAQELLLRAQNSGNLQQEVWALRHKALCVIDVDHPREAVEILEFITKAMRESGDVGENICTQGMVALALARIGRNGKSIRAAAETLRLLRNTNRPTGHVTLVGISGVCEVLLRGREAGLSNRYGQWREWERQALYELKRYRRVFPVGEAQYGLWNGVSHWLDGRNSLAISTWNSAIESARRLSLRRDEAMIAAEMRRRS
jgi:class 3 adenylate cyclase